MTTNEQSARNAPAGATLGVDIGGTFTDVALLDPSGRLWEHKISTSTGSEADAFIQGSLELLERAGVAPGDVGEVIHASTIATNAILEHKGPEVGLITTEGFRDVLEIARIRTPSLYDLEWQKPAALVKRRNRREVRERIGADGGVVAELDEQGVLEVIREFKETGIDTIAVCLINSPINDAHERRIGELLETEFPECTFSLSIDVLRELKEYERTSTTVINAYLRPVLRRYLGNIRQRLDEAGIQAPLRVMRSDGGMMSDTAAQQRPMTGVISGPAAGVLAAEVVAQRAEVRDVLAFDMGGTTAKAALVEDGRLPRTNEYEVRAGISTPSRFIKAGGYLLMVPAVDIAEVGNGAGSIARVDAGGALRVGPESAGAVPGPACYGRGGEQPTITDANVVLGRLNSGALVGGALEIDADRAYRAIEERVARPLGIDVIEAAWGIHHVANSNMMRAIRSVTVERGRDPRAVSLVAFGGSGPVHAVDVAASMHIPKVIVPRLSGLLSAVGLLSSRMEKSDSRAFVRLLADTAEPELREALASLAAECADGLRAEGHEIEETELLLDLRFSGQENHLSIPFGDGPDALDRVVEEFDAEYARTYGSSLNDEPIEIANLRVIVRGPERERQLSDFALADPAESEGTRRSYFGPELGFMDTPVIRREDLGATPTAGPLLIDEYDTTVVVPPRAQATITEQSDIHIEVNS